MLMMVQPLRDAIHEAKKTAPGKTKVIYLSLKVESSTNKG